MSEIAWLVIIYAATALLLIGLAIPMARGSVKPNWYYGVRVPKTVRDPVIWDKANRFGGKALMAAGVIMLVCTIGAALIPGITPDQYAVLSLIFAGVPLTIAVVAILVYVYRL